MIQIHLFFTNKYAVGSTAKHKELLSILLIDNIILVFMHCRTVYGNDLRFTPYRLETQHDFMLCRIFAKTFVFLRHIEKQKVAQNEAPRDTGEVICNVVTSKFVLTPAFKRHAFLNLS